jgi:hypothetical protein
MQFFLIIKANSLKAQEVDLSTRDVYKKKKTSNKIKKEKREHKNLQNYKY